MSISPVGNSDAYARYRQQALDLLASPSQPSTQPAATTTSPSYVAPTGSTEPISSNPFAAKFKADLTALNSPQGGTSGTHGAHGRHHHHNGGALSSANANSTDPNSTTDSTDSTSSSTDPFSQALDEFASVVNETVDPAAA